MNTQATLEQLHDLKLLGMAQAYQAILGLSSDQHPDAHTLLAQLAQLESQQRNHSAMHVSSYGWMGMSLGPGLL